MGTKLRGKNPARTTKKGRAEERLLRRQAKGLTREEVQKLLAKGRRMAIVRCN